MAINLIHFKYLLLTVIFTLGLSSASYAQERFLLNAADMPGYQLISTETLPWRISADSLKLDVVQQRWSNQKDECYIAYGEFDSEADAYKGTGYESQSFAGPFIFGSPTGEIIGNSSWVSLDQYVVFFQKGNIGIKIIRPVEFNTEDSFNILNLSNKLLTKINDNISIEIANKDKELLKSRISIEYYNLLTKASFDLLTSKGYNEFKVDNSKWILNKDSLVMGQRKQWSISNSISSIDVTRFSNEMDAQNATENKVGMTGNTYCLLDDTASVSAAINDYFKFINRHSKYVSIVGRIGNYAIQFYYFNENGVDINFFKRVVLAINSEGTGVADLENTGIKVYPNPATNFITIENANGKSERTIVKLMNLDGVLVSQKNIQFSGSYRLDLSDVKQGAYLLKMQMGNQQITKLIIVTH